MLNTCLHCRIGSRLVFSAILDSIALLPLRAALALQYANPKVQWGRLRDVAAAEWLGKHVSSFLLTCMGHIFCTPPFPWLRVWGIFGCALTPPHPLPIWAFMPLPCQHYPVDASIIVPLFWHPSLGWNPEQQHFGLRLAPSMLIMIIVIIQWL